MKDQEAGAYFKGLLANVDSSILQIDLNHGFRIESFSDEEAMTFIENLEKIPRKTIAQEYFMRCGCLNFAEQRMYAISKLFENVSTLDFPEIARFDNTLVLGYLDPIIRLMRLFKEGDIRLPVKFYYQIQNKEIKGRTIGIGSYISREPYHLEAFEVPILQNFIHSVKLPFQRDFVQLAFENFELSYQISDIQLAFVVLMIGLEALLNPASDEVRYRVSRNTAVLLGEEREDSEQIFTQVKKLYDRRSEIIHSGKRRIVEKADLLTLRDYVRRAIKEIYCIDMEKDKIMNLLDSCGFGEKIEKS